MRATETQTVSSSQFQDFNEYDSNVALQAISIVIQHHIRVENEIFRQRFMDKLTTVYRHRASANQFRQVLAVTDMMADVGGVMNPRVRFEMLRELSGQLEVGAPLGICRQCHQHIERIVDVDFYHQEDDPEEWDMMVFTICHNQQCPTMDLYFV